MLASPTWSSFAGSLEHAAASKDCGGTGAIEAVRAVHNDVLARLRVEVRHQCPNKRVHRFWLWRLAAPTALDLLPMLGCELCHTDESSGVQWQSMGRAPYGAQLPY